jgi:hypothetical protein
LGDGFSHASMVARRATVGCLSTRCSAAQTAGIGEGVRREGSWLPTRRERKFEGCGIIGSAG